VTSDTADMVALAHALRGQLGVAMVVPFGTMLHVSGTDAGALERAIAPYRSDPDLHWTASETGLEDVFIQMMGRAEDNFANGKPRRAASSTQPTP
jgi:ABC-2 type transport system ATP-binding protein